jgi:DNA-damage-inducible protein J
MAQVSIRIDDNVKDDADKLFEELGLTLSGAVNIFVRQALRQRGIPFVVTMESDPFYDIANMRWIESSQYDKYGKDISFQNPLKN